MEQAQTASAAKEEELDQLKAEVLRLKEFENQQVEFQRIQKEFYDEVVYSDKGPGAEEYKKYYFSVLKGFLEASKEMQKEIIAHKK